MWRWEIPFDYSCVEIYEWRGEMNKHAMHEHLMERSHPFFPEKHEF
jgi:hypothetical protein